MPATDLNNRLLTKLQMYTLVALLAMSAAAHFWHFSVWIGVFFLAVILTRLVSIYAGKQQLSRWLIYTFLIAGLINVAFHYRGAAVGKDFGVSLLVSMLALKVLETRSYRDGYVLLFLTCFMIVTQFLYNQNLGFAAYLFSLLLGVVSMLLWLNQVDNRLRPAAFTQLAIRLLALSAPMMLALFILFPRLDAPLWAFKTDTGAALTGISGKITPGSISHLSQSSATAFRVKFSDDRLPPPKQRYWRGPVLTQTDGINWQADEDGHAAEIHFKPLGEALHYQLTIEPSQQKWLFALDFPASIPAGSFMTDQYSVMHKEKISTRQTFAFTSYTEYQTLDTSPAVLQAALAVPSGIPERTRAFVKQQLQQHPDKKDFILAVLKHFNQENFIYTLRPPLLGKHPTDEFLFETRKGFCEHYATSFVILLRLAGIPARVVAGYQGGEWNPTGKHLIVRQSDAHAWTEVWLRDKGWLRFDPTAAVSPERIERTLDPDNQTEGSPVVFRLSNDGTVGMVLQQLSWFADSVDLNWHRWVVGFSQERQSRLLQSAGLEFLKGYKLGLAAIFAGFVMLILIAVISRLKAVRPSDPAKKIWDRFCRKLRRRGIECQTTEGPHQISQHAQQSLPEKAAVIELITRLYINSRYTRLRRAEDLHTFRTLVNKF